MKQNRLKSPVLWQSLISAVLMFLINAGIIGAELQESILNLLNAMFAISISVGIFNVPTEAEKF